MTITVYASYWLENCVFVAHCVLAVRPIGDGRGRPPTHPPRISVRADYFSYTVRFTEHAPGEQGSRCLGGRVGVQCRLGGHPLPPYPSLNEVTNMDADFHL